MNKLIDGINRFLFTPNFEESHNYRVIILIVFIASIISMFPVGKAIEYEYQLGSVWTYDDLTAPFSIPIFKDDDQYKADVKKAEENILPIFRSNNDIYKSNSDSLYVFFGKLKNILTLQLQYNSKKYSIYRDSAETLKKLYSDSSQIAKLKNELGIYFSSEEWIALQKMFIVEKNNIYKLDTFSIEKIRSSLLAINQRITEKGFLNNDKTDIPTEDIAVRKNNIEQIHKKFNFYDRNDLINSTRSSISSLYPESKDIENVVLKINLHLIKPNIFFDKEQTEKEKAISIETVPFTLGIVKENEKIISRYEKVTQDAKLKIDSYRKAKVQRTGNMNLFLQYIGKFGHTSVILLIFIIYLYLFRKKITSNNTLITLIVILFLLISFITYITTQIHTNLPIQYLIFLPAASMLLTVIFDSRVGFYGTVTLALIVSAIRGNDYAIFFATLSSGTLAVYTVRDIKNRSQIFRSILYIMMGYSLSIISLGLERYDSTMNIITELVYAGISSVLSPILTYGFSIFFERVFRISTDITLLELSDFNHPLLKELAAKAPGTFHHSVVIGSLSEGAAESIGANPLLARVGAYYHDVGKMVKPEYFIENLSGGKNKHDKLTPSMSTLIIISHVKEGVDLAKRYRIPQKVMDFIPMHHGTTLVKYFYEKAQRKRNTKEEVREIDFRYPGPKPNSKETAIVMLADTIEASIRSMSEPTVSKIESLIEDVVKTRLLEGELDKCNLTIQDLSKIRESFLKIFIGIHHKRIKYPEPSGAE